MLDRNVSGMYPYTAYSIVFLIISWLLDIVPSNYRRISMIVVAGICGEVDFSKELLLMMLESSDHFDQLLLRALEL